MTIAAGFKCQDSVILCTDLEITYPTLKLPEKKIFPLNVPNREMNIAFATAGTFNYAKSAFQFIKKSLLELSKGTFDTTSLQVFLEDQLCMFHEKHIYKHPRYGYTDGPQVFFVIAAQFKNEQNVSLFATDETTVNPEHPYCFRGSGEEIARYVVEPLTMPQFDKRPAKEILLVATHMLRQVQKSAGYCGQGSSFFRLSNDGDFHPVHHFPLPMVDSYSDTFQGILESAFFAGADLDMDDSMVKAYFRIAPRMMEQIRAEQRDEKRRRQELEDILYGKKK